jgi:hypothetical protein
VPKQHDHKDLILREAHDTLLSIHPGSTKMYHDLHPGSTKMYHDLRYRFWWTRMKQEIDQFLAECDTCRRVKAEQQRPTEMV